MRVVTILTLLCLALVNASPIAAQSVTTAYKPPSVKATPELDSLVLFGAGAAGVAGYVLLRRRAGRRRDEDLEKPTAPAPAPTPTKNLLGQRSGTT